MIDSRFHSPLSKGQLSQAHLLGTVHKYPKDLIDSRFQSPLSKGQLSQAHLLGTVPKYPQKAPGFLSSTLGVELWNGEMMGMNGEMMGMD